MKSAILAFILKLVIEKGLPLIDEHNDAARVKIKELVDGLIKIDALDNLANVAIDGLLDLVVVYAKKIASQQLAPEAKELAIAHAAIEIQSQILA